MKKQSFMPMSAKNRYKTQITHQNAVARKREDDLVSGAFNLALLLTVMAARDEFEFGTKRLERLIDKVQFYLNQYNDGYVSVNDMASTIYEETGIQMMDLEILKQENYKYREDR